MFLQNEQCSIWVSRELRSLLDLFGNFVAWRNNYCEGGVTTVAAAGIMFDGMAM